jgi:hypothetical protein
MKTVSVTDKLTADDLLKQGHDGDVVVLRNGHAVGLLVPFDDDDLEWYQRERDPAFIASIDRARQQVVKRQTISHDELKRKLGIA